MTTPIVLIADDEAPLRHLFEQALQRANMACAHAVDGEDALRVAHEQPVQVVLLDVNLPKLHGLEVCRRLKAESHSRGAAVVFVSAEDDPGVIARARRLGAADYLVKPVSPAYLVDVVRRLLAAREPAA